MSATMLTACAGEARGRAGADLGATGAETGGDTLGPYEMHSPDPATAEGLFTRLQLAETLVEAEGTGELKPGLATGWNASGDGLAWTFELREGAVFHDGTPVDAAAVVAALDVARSSEANTSAVAPIESVRAEDGADVVELSEQCAPLPAVPAETSTQILAPSAYADDGTVSQVVGSGPYSVVDVAPPARIELEPFEGYPGQSPAVDRVVCESVGRAENRALMAESGQADITFGMDPTGLQRVEDEQGLRIESALLPRTIVLKLDNEHPALSGERVREALSMALHVSRGGSLLTIAPDLDLARSGAETVGCLMDQVVEHDAALVLVTHDLDLAAAVAERHVALGGAAVPPRGRPTPS